MVAVGDRVRYLADLPLSWDTLEIRFVNDVGQIFAIDKLASRPLWIELKVDHELSLQPADASFVGLWYRIPAETQTVMKRGRYSAEEIAIITVRYPTDAIDAIAADLDRGRTGVAWKANELGLRKPHRRPWTDDEFEQVRRRYADEPAVDIARDLERHVSTIYYQAGQMGLSKSAEFLKRMADHARPWEDWSDEDVRILTERYPHEKTEGIGRDLKRTVMACYGMANKLDLHKTEEFGNPGNIQPGQHRGRKFEFKPGHVPANKGLRRPGFAPGRMAETQFKKGHVSANLQQVGELRYAKKDGAW